MKPSSESPQPKSNASYVRRRARRIKAPTMERQMVFTARVEAACSVNAWIRSFAERQKSCPTPPQAIGDRSDEMSRGKIVFPPTINPAKNKSEY